jgi:hypothetical protein
MVLTAQQTAILAVARQQLGKGYRFGAKGPDEFDCSGLTSWVYLHGANITLDAGTVGQLLDGNMIVATNANVPWSKVVSLLEPCDLVFPSVDHVQLWTGSDVVEAANASSPVHEVAEWATTVYAVRRVLSAVQKPPGAPRWPGRYLELIPLPGAWLTGSDVRAWQAQFNLVAASRIGVPKLSVDSVYGPNTAAATKAFQRAMGLVQDGIVGPISWATAFQYPAAPA